MFLSLEITPLRNAYDVSTRPPKSPLLNLYVVGCRSNTLPVFNVRLYLFRGSATLSSVYGTTQKSTLLMRYYKLLAICTIFPSFILIHSGLFFLLRSGRKSAPRTSAERTRFSSIVLGFTTALKGSPQQITQRFDFVSTMTSECVVVRDFFAREACENVSPITGEMSSNGSLETETIQKFLSICLKQYFNSSQDETKVRFGCSEILNENVICYFVAVYFNSVVMFVKSDQRHMTA